MNIAVVAVTNRANVCSHKPSRMYPSTTGVIIDVVLSIQTATHAECHPRERRKAFIEAEPFRLVWRENLRQMQCRVDIVEESASPRTEMHRSKVELCVQSERSTRGPKQIFSCIIPPCIYANFGLFGISLSYPSMFTCLLQFIWFTCPYLF